MTDRMSLAAYKAHLAGEKQTNKYRARDAYRCQDCGAEMTKASPCPVCSSPHRIRFPSRAEARRWDDPVGGAVAVGDRIAFRLKCGRYVDGDVMQLSPDGWGYVDVSTTTRQIIWQVPQSALIVLKSSHRRKGEAAK